MLYFAYKLKLNSKGLVNYEEDYCNFVKQSKAKQSHNCLLNNNYLKFLFQKYFFNLVKTFLTSINFLSVFIRFAKNQFEIISHCHSPRLKSAVSEASYGNEGNARDKVWQSPSNLFCVDCHDFLRSLAMTIKNNFAILNLVKSFLNSIKFTFDNLSRKIKKPCLVINKNLFSRRIFMENIKKILITVLSFLVLFSVSCDNEGKTGSGGAGVGGDGSSGGSQSKSELVGTWQSTEKVEPYRFKIDDNGNISFALNSFGVNYLYYTGKIADTFDYPYTVEIVSDYYNQKAKGTFTFNNEANCNAVFYTWDAALAKFFDWKVEKTFTN